MSTRIGVGANVGNGVYVGTSTSAGTVAKFGLLFVLVMPGVIWFCTGISLLKDILAALLGSKTPMDLGKARDNLVCFALTLVEVAIYVSLIFILR